MTAITTLKAGLVAAAVAAVSIPSIAAALSTGDAVGTSEADIRAALEGEGYNIDEIAIEVEATRDGKTYEIEISLETGEVVEIELEDDDDD